MRLVLACLVMWLAARTGLAQDVRLARVDEMRTRAAARGWVSDVGTESGRTVERWCAQPPCAEAPDRFELHLASGTLVELRVILHDAADGFALDAVVQSSGSFGFRFTRGEEVVDLTWELNYEPPGLSVGFSAQDVNEVVAMDPSDGAHAFALWIARELSRQLSSAASLRDHALAQRTALRAAVVRGVASGATVREGTFAECFQERSFPGATGIFDVCPMRMATADEQRVALAALDARLSMERAALRAHFRAFHRVLAETLASAAPAR